MIDLKIGIVGLGYVGLPLACLFSVKFQVFGYDSDNEKINELKSGYDRTGEVGQKLFSYPINYSHDPSVLKGCNFIIVAVPTPIDKNNQPDLTLVEKATTTVGQNLSQGTIIVYESTVYPGCTEELCCPIIESESGLVFNRDFFLGYSPERVNPGDHEHTIDKIVKIVSGSTPETLKIVSHVYGSVTRVYPVADLKTAEAAKVIENIQRDLNIALMNELSLIFERLEIDTREVIEAAGTKWNFIKYYPGLVGGHCISVDPYYLTYRSLQLGYRPQVILAGRGVNDYMPHHVAEMIIKALKDAGKNLTKAKVLILGLTFKENVPDLRNSKIKKVIEDLKKQGLEIYGHDPLVKNDFIEEYFGFNNSLLNDVPKVDVVIVFSPHQVFAGISLADIKSMMADRPILIDIKRFYDKNQAKDLGIIYKHL